MVERLTRLKQEHEARHQGGVEPPDKVADGLVVNFKAMLLHDSVIHATGQTGGQTAHSIMNVSFAQPAAQVASQHLVELVELPLDDHPFRLLKGLLSGDLKESLDVALNAVFAMPRTNRNDAGHPTGKTVRREEAYASLTVFPTYLKKVYELMAWLKGNAPLA